MDCVWAVKRINRVLFESSAFIIWGGTIWITIYFTSYFSATTHWNRINNGLLLIPREAIRYFRISAGCLIGFFRSLNRRWDTCSESERPPLTDRQMDGREQHGPVKNPFRKWATSNGNAPGRFPGLDVIRLKGHFVINHFCLYEVFGNKGRKPVTFNMKSFYYKSRAANIFHNA